jgi:RNA methyltransferase, TrmH family
MEPVTSRANPRVKAAAALHRRRARREAGRHLVEGPNVVAEAIDAGVVETLFGLPDAIERLRPPDGVTTIPVTAPVLERLAGTPSPQGVVAVARTVTAAPDEVATEGLLVVLHEVADPGNVGTILRTADAAGAAGVWLTPASADVFSPKAVRAAAGSTYHLPVTVDVELGVLVDHAHATGRRVLGLDGGASSSVLELDDDLPVALVLGNEAHGLDAGARARLDALVAVPMRGRAESLNVAAAAAIAIYAAAGELRRPPRWAVPRE